MCLCTGKQVIHPGQIQAVQEEFSPSQERVQWATALVEAFGQHQLEGKVHRFSLASNTLLTPPFRPFIHTFALHSDM